MKKERKGVCARRRCSTCPGEHDRFCAGLVCIRMTVIYLKMPYALVRHHVQQCAPSRYASIPVLSVLCPFYGCCTWYYDAFLSTQVRWTYPVSVVVLIASLNLPYPFTYGTPPPPAVQRCLTRSPGAAPLLPSCHIFLPSLLLAHAALLSCLCPCGLGICPFSELVCDLLQRQLFHGPSKAHCQRVSQSQS